MAKKLSKAENKVFKSVWWGGMGWATLFFLLSLVVMGLLGVVLVFSGMELPSEDELPMGLWIFVLLSWPIVNGMIGFPMLHLLLKKRVKKGTFQLAEGISFAELRKKVFIRWFWQVLLWQLAFAVAFIALGMAGINTGNGSNVSLNILMMAGVAQMVCMHSYRKGYFSIPEPEQALI